MFEHHGEKDISSHRLLATNGLISFRPLTEDGGNPEEEKIDGIGIKAEERNTGRFPLVSNLVQTSGQSDISLLRKAAGCRGKGNE